MRHRRAVITPVGDVAHIAEIRARGVEVVPDRDVVQIVRRPIGVDDDARCGVVQDRDRQLVCEGNTDGCRGPARRILLVDFLDRYEEVLAVRMDAARRAVREPDLVALNGVARHLARVHDVIEDDQPALVGLAWLCQEADVAAQRVGRGKVPDRAVAVDLNLGRRNRVDKAIDHAAAIGNAVVRPSRGGQQQRCEGEQQDSNPAVTHPHIVRAARSHVRPPFPSPSAFVAGRNRGQSTLWLWTGFRRSRRRRATEPVRPVTLRRHLSMALPFSESRRELADQMTPNLLVSTPRFHVITSQAGSRSGTRSSRFAHRASRRN